MISEKVQQVGCSRYLASTFSICPKQCQEILGEVKVKVQRYLAPGGGSAFWDYSVNKYDDDDADDDDDDDDE